MSGKAVSRRGILGAGAAAGIGAMAATGAAAATVVAGCANSGSFDPGLSTDARPSGILIPLAEVPVGAVASLMIDRRPAFVARPGADTVRAFSAICTHQGCTVVSAGTQLVCPCHGSQFDLLTGEVLRGPAQEPLPPIEVAIDGENVIRV